MVIAGLLESNQHEKNAYVHQKHQQESIDAISIAHYTTPHLTLHGMVKSHIP